MSTVLFIKSLIFAVIVLFLLIELSSVYTWSIFNEIVTLEDGNVGTKETALDVIRKIIDGGLPNSFIQAIYNVYYEQDSQQGVIVE